MSITFSGSELINIAISIERRGIAFYDVMAKSVENERLRDIFQYLVDMEHQHLHTFQDMLAETEELKLPEAFTGEHAAYLEALVDSAVFTDDDITSGTVTRVESDIEAVDAAIGLEKDSILFYCQMKDLAPLPVQKVLDTIIDEEKTHLRDLSQIKKQLIKSGEVLE
jgi:rubrerythrin